MQQPLQIVGTYQLDFADSLVKSMPAAAKPAASDASRHAMQQHFANFGAFHFHDAETIFKYMI